MFWTQKAAILTNNQQRADTLEANITNYLADKNTTYLDIQQFQYPNRNQAHVIIQVNYVNQVDSDQVWQDINDANTAGWVVTPSFAAYALMNDDGSVNTLLGRIDW